MEVYQDISIEDHILIAQVYPKPFGYQLHNKRRITKIDLQKLKARNFDIEQICQDLFSKSSKEYFYVLMDYKIQRYLGNDLFDPRMLDFTVTLINNGKPLYLDKDDIKYNHKGSPLSVKYFHEGEEILKREWNFTFFNVSSIMGLLGQPEAIANLMADDLIWIREEKFYYIMEDGTYSDLFYKSKRKDFVPFNEGMPNIAKFYLERIAERVKGRNTIYEMIQLELVPFIMAGANVGVEGARDIGRTFLFPNNTALEAYIKSADLTIIAIAIADTVNDFFNYPTSLSGVDCRKWFVNRLRQIQNLETAI